MTCDPLILPDRKGDTDRIGDTFNRIFKKFTSQIAKAPTEPIGLLITLKKRINRLLAYVLATQPLESDTLFGNTTPLSSGFFSPL